MNAKYFILSLLLLFTHSGFCQENKDATTQHATFCGKIGLGGDSKPEVYSAEELKSCDFKISPLDSTLSVVEFRLSIVSFEKSAHYSEIKITGNKIPLEYRDAILSKAKNVFLEFIKAINARGEVVEINPIGIRIRN